MLVSGADFSWGEHLLILSEKAKTTAACTEGCPRPQRIFDFAPWWAFGHIALFRSLLGEHTGFIGIFSLI
jgi:hypothetical protein